MERDIVVKVNMLPFIFIFWTIQSYEKVYILHIQVSDQEIIDNLVYKKYKMPFLKDFIKRIQLSNQNS